MGASLLRCLLFIYGKAGPSSVLIDTELSLELSLIDSTSSLTGSGDAVVTIEYNFVCLIWLSAHRFFAHLSVYL